MQLELNALARPWLWLLVAMGVAGGGFMVKAQVGRVDSLTRYAMAYGEYKELVKAGREAVREGWATAEIHRRMALAYRMLHNNEHAVDHWRAASGMVPGSELLAGEYRQELLNCRRMDEWRWATMQNDASDVGVLALDYALVHAGLQYPSGSLSFRDEVDGSALALRQANNGQGLWAYAETLIQGPVTVWGGTLQNTLRMPGRRGPYRISLLQSLTRFDARTFGRVQSAYWDTVAFKAADTTLRTDFISHSTLYAQRWEGAHARFPGWKWGLGFMFFGERSQYLSTEPYSTDLGLRALTTSYSHNALALSGTVSRRMRAKEYRLGILSGTLNRQRQWQADAGLVWWPWGNPRLQVSLEVSALSNGPLAMDSPRSVVGVGHLRLGAQVSPGLWLELRTLQGPSLRNYTQPGTFWAMNTADPLSSVWVLSGRWTPASNADAIPSGSRWSLAPFVQRMRLQSSIQGLAWANVNEGLVDPTPRSVTRSYTTIFWGIALVWNPANL
ncbi:MAG: hypothetical protein ACKO17_06195 [Bacteroidota bacterium]